MYQRISANKQSPLTSQANILLTSTVILKYKLVRLPVCTDRCFYLEGRYEITVPIVHTEIHSDVMLFIVYCYNLQLIFVTAFNSDCCHTNRNASIGL